MKLSENMGNKDIRQSLKIPPELHREIKVAAAAEGREMYALLEDVWEVYRSQKDRSWKPKHTQPAAFGELSKLEEASLRAVLEMLRDENVLENDPGSVKPSLIALGKRWLKRHQK
jgi:predicted HTH domain antitoxin